MMSDDNTPGLVPPRQKTFKHNSSGLETNDYSNEPSSSKLVPNDVRTVEKTDTSPQDLELLFSPMYEEYFNAGNQSVSKSSALWTSNPQSPRGIFINQSKYALKILKKHGMVKCNSIGTPMDTSPKLDADLSGTPIDKTNYQSMIVSLMYLTSSRPDLVQAVFYCARYQAGPTEKHLKEIKRIFWYLKKTINIGIWYSKDSSFELTAFLDVDHVGCLDTQKSTSGGIQFLGDKLVSWMSKKQDYTAMSIAKVEYVVLSVENSIVELYFVRTKYQLADMFTKALLKEIFEYIVGRLDMRCLAPEELEHLANETTLCNIKHHL
uniref:Reverse transcriptase Ty1/copia-type domain-containing protein n=1 Tax=Tanacetum cinerariifolium TaxID=118510 RepID=A0A6L2MVT6_TANCI|nr:hypothetical protein [Tanacetum cinerariifolium]